MLDSPKINVKGFLCALLAGTFLAGAAVVEGVALDAADSPLVQ